METCYYCGKEFSPEDLRPYGPNAAWVCHPCATTPEHIEQTQAALHKRFNASLAESNVILFTETGPKPV